MAAMYRITYTTESGRAESFILHAADAKSLKPAHVRAAHANARKRARARLKRKGITARGLSVACIG